MSDLSAAAATSTLAVATTAVHNNTAVRVHFVSAEKVRFTDDDTNFKSKVLLYSECTATLAFDPASSYPFPHFHIPTREEEWKANREAAVQAAREAGITPSALGRKRKNASAMAPVPSDMARRSTRTPRSAAVKDADVDDAEEMGEDEDDNEESGDEGGEDSKMNSEVDDSLADDRSSIGSASAAAAHAPKRRGRPPGTKNRPRDPDAALEWEMRKEEAEKQAGTERLTKRQRTMLLQESGEASSEDQLVSLPNRPLKSKSVTELSEEQLARKQAANERRKLSEKERMEKEKTDTIQKLLTNTPAKRGEKAAAAGAAASAEKMLGAIPKAARIRSVKKSATGGVKGEPGEEDDLADGEGEEVEEEEAMPTAEEDEAAAKERRNYAKYNRNKILWRQFLEVKDSGALSVQQQQVKLEDTSNDSAPSSSALIPAAILHCTVSFPAAAPLPPSPLFSLSANVAHLAEYKRVQRQLQQQRMAAEANASGLDATMDADTATAAPSSATPSVALPPTSLPDLHVRAPRPNCARPGCTNQRRYTDSRSHLPLCSLDCLKLLQETEHFQTAVATAHASKPSQPTAAA